MKKTITSCDVCKSDVNAILENKLLQIIFTTDQTEGSGTYPYLCEGKIDICEKCLDKILAGNYLFGHGAQGNNTYYFKGEEK